MDSELKEKSCAHEALQTITGIDGLNYEYCPICNYSKQIPMTSDQIKSFIKYCNACAERDINLSPNHYWLA